MVDRNTAGEIRGLALQRGFRVGFARGEDLDGYAGIFFAWVIRQRTRRTGGIMPGAKTALPVAAQIRDPSEDLAAQLGERRCGASAPAGATS